MGDAVQVKDPKTKTQSEVVVRQDDGIRANSNMASLSRLPAAFKENGSTTAGNSSQVRTSKSATCFVDVT